MFEETIEQLRKRELIRSDDVVIVCADMPSALAGLGGIFIAAIVTAKIKTYIAAVNANRILLFDVDKKHGTYLETLSQIKKENVKRAVVSKLIGGKSIFIKADFGTIKLQARSKIKRYIQKQSLADFADLIKSEYPSK